MTTQTRERDLVIEMESGAVQAKERSEAQKSCQAIPEQEDGVPNSHIITKVLSRFAKQLVVAYDLLVAPPATERERISNAMIKGEHDRYVSFLR